MVERPMKRSELASMLLLTLNALDFLQFVDEAYEERDADSRSLVERFLGRRYPSLAPKHWSQLLPFAQKLTALPLLAPAVAFAKVIQPSEWANVGFRIKADYGLVYLQD